MTNLTPGATRGRPPSEGVPKAETHRALSARRRGPDGATLLGLGGSLALIATAMALGGSATAFFDLPAALIVLAGTVAVTTISFGLSDIAGLPAALLKAVLRQGHDPQAVARLLLAMAEMAREHGPATLARLLPDLRGDPFTQHAVSLLAEGLPAETIERMLGSEIEAQCARHAGAGAILRRGAEVAPAMGLIGTLVGLVQMLGGLDDPGTIGPSMAVALLTTFYGAVLGNVVLAPLAGKLDRRSGEETLVRTLVLIGAASAARQENPRRLEMLLNAVLPPAQRIRYFES
ncbi:MAG TPA: MotA/TolQ/ExbB proton channel family protein [Acetobacteraceae bacterium]|jgi:chemotaxis protein MotA